jgi:hypothetical protein
VIVLIDVGRTQFPYLTYFLHSRRRKHEAGSLVRHRPRPVTVDRLAVARTGSLKWTGRNAAAQVPRLAVASAEGGGGAGRAEEGLPIALAAEPPGAHLVDHVRVVRATMAGAEARAAEDRVAVEGGAAAGGELAWAGGGVTVVRRPVRVAGGRGTRSIAEKGALGAAGGVAALVEGVKMVGGLVQYAVEEGSLAVAEGGPARAPFDENAVRMAKVGLTNKPVEFAMSRFVWLAPRFSK